MVKDDHNTNPPAEQTRATECPPARGIKIQTVIAAALVATVLTVGSVFLVRWLADKPEANGGVPAPNNGPMLFQGWNKPDFVLLLSGQQHGYILPCGCSKPQVGGLERRFNFLKTLEDRGWPVVAVDLGDTPQDKGPRDLPNIQGMIKYRYSLLALNKMNYAAVGLGQYETTMPVPLEAALTEYGTLGQQTPIVASNVARDKSFVFQNETVAWRLAEVPNTKHKVAVVSVVGKDVAGKIQDKNVTFDSVTATLQGVPNDATKPGLLKEIQKSKPDLQVLLFHGDLDAARLCAKAFPNFNVVLCLSAEDEPPARPETVTHKDNSTTMLVTVGHKGKNLGVVGCFARDGKPANGMETRYQMVRLTEPEYLTPKGKENDHPIVQLMEEYTKELKEKNYLSKYPQVPHKLQGEEAAKGLTVPSFVGSEKCMKCHPAAAKLWKASGHAHAYQTLVDATKPALRQHDAECIVCHVVGFGYQTGFESLEKTPKLIDVGCESCHGPASEHFKNPNNVAWQEKLNPFKFDPAVAAKAKKGDTKALLAEKKRIRDLDSFCQKCHDQDNDVHWDFNLKWPKVEHHTPAPAHAP